MPKVKQEVVPETQQNYSAMAGNALLCGLSVTYVFGNNLGYGILMGSGLGAACMVAHIALACLNKQDKQHFWFTFDSKTVEHLKDYWKSSQGFFKFNIILGIIFRTLGISLQKSTLVWLKYSLMSSPASAIFMIFQICVLAPAAHEVIFRGFVMEKVRDIQVLVLGNEANEILHRKIRNFIQAVGCGALSYSAALGLLNAVTCFANYSIGIWVGEERIKEEVQIEKLKLYNTMYNESRIKKLELKEISKEIAAIDDEGMLALKNFKANRIARNKEKIKKINTAIQKMGKSLGIEPKKKGKLRQKPVVTHPSGLWKCTAFRSHFNISATSSFFVLLSA